MVATLRNYSPATVRTCRLLLINSAMLNVQRYGSGDQKRTRRIKESWKRIFFDEESSMINGALIIINDREPICSSNERFADTNFIVIIATDKKETHARYSFIRFADCSSYARGFRCTTCQYARIGHSYARKQSIRSLREARRASCYAL